MTSCVGAVATGSGVRVPGHEGGGTRHPSPSALRPLQSLSTAQPPPSPGPNARQQEDALSATDGLPRWQVPVPSQAAPPQLSICAGALGGDGKASSPGAWAGLSVGGFGCCSRSVGRGRGRGGPVPSFHCPLTSLGTSSVSDEGPSEESHSPEGLCQAPGPPVLVQKEACGAGDGAAGSPGDPSVLPCPHGQPGKQGRAGILMTGLGSDVGTRGPRVGVHPMR